MTERPQFLLCCRCSSALAIEATDEAKRWAQLVQNRKTTLDICPTCIGVVLKVLRVTPDMIEIDR